MNRRDFLKLRTDAGRPLFELSCERLYMVYANTRDEQPPKGSTPTAGRVAAADEHEVDPSRARDWWRGEPPTVVERASADEVFRNLERRLADFEILRVLERDWLSADEAFGARVRALLRSFEARGGRVEYSD